MCEGNVVGNMAMLMESKHTDTLDRGGSGVALMGVLGYIGMLGTPTIQPQPKAFQSKKEGVGGRWTLVDDGQRKPMQTGRKQGWLGWLK